MAADSPTDAVLARHLYRLALAHKDITGAELTCEGFKQVIMGISGKLPYPTNYAFWTAIVTCYARPFIDNKGVGVLPKAWRSFSDGRLQRAHNLIMKARNEVYAHSDITIAKMFVIPAGAEMPGVGRRAPRPSWYFQSYEIPPDAIIDVHDCCTDLKQRLEKEVTQMTEALCAKNGATAQFELKWASP